VQGDIFFQDKNLPHVECRYSTDSSRDFKAHLHHRFSIGAIKKGRVQFNHAGEEIILSPGALALINPGTMHSCNTLSKSGRSFYMLYLDPEWCFSLQQTIWEIDSFCPASQFCLIDRHIFTLYCQTMDTLLDREVFLLEKEQLLTELVRSIFLALNETDSLPHQEKATLPEHTPDIATVKRLLAVNLQEDITLADIAAQIQANPFTLIRRFKAVTGTTPHAYRMNCRIEQARSLMQAGHDIADTAYECGFYDQSHLHRHFKAMTTVTPQQYRLNFLDSSVQ